MKNKIQKDSLSNQKYKTTLVWQKQEYLMRNLEKIMYFNAEITKLVKDNPHDADLGFEIRKLYTNK